MNVRFVVTALVGVVFCLLLPVQSAFGAFEEERVLGWFNVSVKSEYIYFPSDVKKAWGSDRGIYNAFQLYGRLPDGSYMGGEAGYARLGDGMTDNGEKMEDVVFYSFEFNQKWLFSLPDNFSAGLGYGLGILYVEGWEVTDTMGAQEKDNLATFGFGLNVFGELNWRYEKFFAGIDGKFQFAEDDVGFNNNNVRVGAHAGFAFGAFQLR